MTDQALAQQKGQKFIKRLSKFESPWYFQILAFFGLFALFYLFTGQNYSIAINVMIGMFLHECSHAFVFARNKIPFKIQFLFPLGAAAMPANDEADKLSDRLPWWNISWLLQAGPLANILLMLVGTFLDNSGVTQIAQFGRDMIFVNGLLGISNLVPIWQLDAGQLYFVIFSSLREKYDMFITKFSIALTILVITVLIIPPVLTHDVLGVAKNLWGGGKTILLLICLVVFAAGMWHNQGRDDPKLADSIQAMSLRQVLIQMIVYFLVVFFGLYLAFGAA